MLLTRAQIQEKLDALSAAMSRMIKEHEDRGDLLCAFAGQADEITDHVGEADDVWANQKLDALLKAYGFSPEDEIPCDG